MNNLTKSFVMPGTLIGINLQMLLLIDYKGTTHEYNPGKGTYVVGEQIFAGVAGNISNTANDNQNEVSVVPKVKSANAEGENKKLYISLGTEVYGKVFSTFN